MKPTMKTTIHATLRKLALTAVIGAALYGTAAAQAPADISDFNSHGIHVILRSTKANQVVAAYLGFEGGLAYGEASNPVVAASTASLIAESGSDKYPKEQFRDELAKLSTTIGGSGSIYNMAFTLRTIAPNFDKAWDLFSDLILHPHFDATEWQKQSQQMMNGIRGRAANPEGYTNFVSDSLWLGNSPLNRTAEIEDVKALGPDKLEQYYRQMRVRSRMTIVVVGNISRAALEAKLAAFDPIPGGTPLPSSPHVTPPSTTSAVLMSRELPTTYMLMRFAAPSIGANEWWAERVLFQILDKRLFDEVRTKRNLSYAPGSYVGGTHGNMVGIITLQSILPDSACRVVLNEVRKLQSTPVPKKELQNAEAGRITTFFYVMQTNLDQARNLYTNQMESGDWRNLFRITSETPKVTAKQVQAVAAKYMHHFQFTLLGPENAAHKDVYRFE